MATIEGRRSTPVTRLQAYLRQHARRQAAVIPAPPFTIVLRQGDAAMDAAAIPDAPVGGDLRAVLATLRAVMLPSQHQLRVAFIAELAPNLARALQTSGFEEMNRTQLLAATPDTLRPAPAVPGLTMVTLDARSSLADVREGLDTNERGFNPQAAPATDADAEEFRRGLVENRAFTARLHGAPAGAGMFNPPQAGVTELVGITTLAPFRRQGIGSFLTAYAAQTAFAFGIDLVYLSTNNPAARRIYERLGFRPYATHLVFRIPPSDENG